MKEYEIDDGTFIGGWYIPEKICDDLIEFYHSSKDEWDEGRVGLGTVMEDFKKCTELRIEPDKLLKLSYTSHLNDCLEEYKKRYPFSDDVYSYGITTLSKIQHYKPGEGFYTWHMENDGFSSIRNRHLVYMTYLNTLDDAGTEFYHQNLKTPCEKGLTIIWPAGWTHTHRGVTNHISDKYIITGWYDFYDQ